MQQLINKDIEMRIEITLHQTTTTEDGRIVPGGTYVAEHDQLNGVHGYDSSDMDRYDSIRLNGRLIDRAIDDADENDNGQQVLEGTGTFKGGSCFVRLFTGRT